MSFGPKSVFGVENSLKNGQKENPEALDFKGFRVVVVATGLEPVTPSM